MQEILNLCCNSLIFVQILTHLLVGFVTHLKVC